MSLHFSLEEEDILELTNAMCVHFSPLVDHRLGDLSSWPVATVHMI